MMADKPKLLTVQEKFSHGRTRSVIVTPKKPLPLPKPPFRPLVPTQEEREWMDEHLKDPVQYVPPVIGTPNYPSVEGTTVTLNRARPQATLRAAAATQCRIVVSGCGPVPRRLPKRKRVIIEMSALGKSSRLALRGITCDGEMALPKATTQVRVELLALGTEVAVTVEGRPVGSRKKATPKRWIVRGTERPISGRARPSKPKI